MREIHTFKYISFFKLLKIYLNMENKNDSAYKSDRRKFIKSTGLALAGITIVPSHVVSGLGHVPPSDKLNIAGIGVGGMGRSNLRNMKTQNIVA